jgi:polar amino acid transport system substrate-binding protein
MLGALPLTEARMLDEIRKSGSLKIAVDGSTPGFNYFEGKKLTGFEVELAEEIAKNMGLKVEWIVQPFNSSKSGPF